jgi:hypothetical protein
LLRQRPARHPARIREDRAPVERAAQDLGIGARQADVAVGVKGLAVAGFPVKGSLANQLFDESR